jgi:hypothetical protein
VTRKIVEAYTLMGWIEQQLQLEEKRAPNR